VKIVIGAGLVAIAIRQRRRSAAISPGTVQPVTESGGADDADHLTVGYIRLLQQPPPQGSQVRERR
jgi:hypothetical protein